MLDRLEEEHSLALVEEAALQEEHAVMIGVLQETVAHIASGEFAAVLGAEKMESDPK